MLFAPLLVLCFVCCVERHTGSPGSLVATLRTNKVLTSTSGRVHTGRVAYSVLRQAGKTPHTACVAHCVLGGFHIGTSKETTARHQRGNSLRFTFATSCAASLFQAGFTVRASSNASLCQAGFHTGRVLPCVCASMNRCTFPACGVRASRCVPRKRHEVTSHFHIGAVDVNVLTSTAEV